MNKTTIIEYEYVFISVDNKNDFIRYNIFFFYFHFRCLFRTWAIIAVQNILSIVHLRSFFPPLIKFLLPFCLRYTQTLQVCNSLCSVISLALNMHRDHYMCKVFQLSNCDSNCSFLQLLADICYTTFMPI